jgi:Spy/CpxP family protein refolding chaperone
MPAKRRTAPQRLLETDRPDWNRYEALLRSGADHHVRAHVAMAWAAANARAELTAEQRARLDTGMAMMREMMHGQMRDLMRGTGPGMMRHDQHQPGQAPIPH